MHKYIHNRQIDVLNNNRIQIVKLRFQIKYLYKAVAITDK